MKRAARTQTVPRSRAFRKIMVAVESPEKAEKPLELAAALASLSGAELVILHVLSPSVPPIIPSPPGFVVPYQLASAQCLASFDQMKKKDERWVSRLVESLEGSGVNAHPEVAMPDAAVADEVVQRAKREGVDLIVTGSSGTGGLRRFLEGSVSTSVMRHASCPVLVVP